MKITRARRSLYCCYVSLNGDYFSQRCVYCYALSTSHAIRLSQSYVVNSLGWDYDSIEVSDPILLNNFIR